MNRYLENFYDLFSEDSSVSYRALLKKKDWLTERCFYLVCTLEDTRDVEDLFDGLLRFRRLYVNPERFAGNESLYQRVSEAFDRCFRVLYLSEELPELGREEFAVRLDFRKLSDGEYRRLFANFYPCIPDKEIPLPKGEEAVQLLPLAMDEALGDAVLILDVSELKESCFSCRVVSALIAPSSAPAEYLLPLERTAASLGADFIRR